MWNTLYRGLRLQGDLQEGRSQSYATAPRHAPQAQYLYCPVKQLISTHIVMRFAQSSQSVGAQRCRWLGKSLCNTCTNAGPLTETGPVHLSTLLKQLTATVPHPDA